MDWDAVSGARARMRQRNKEQSSGQWKEAQERNGHKTVKRRGEGGGEVDPRTITKHSGIN